MGFIKYIENLGINKSVDFENANCEYNPNLSLVLPLAKEFFGNHIDALYLCLGSDLSGAGKFIRQFVKRFDSADEIGDIYSKSFLKQAKRKYDIIIATDAYEPIRKLPCARRRLKEKALVANIKKLLFHKGIALFEDDISKKMQKDLAKNFNVATIGDKFKIIIVEKE